MFIKEEHMEKKHAKHFVISAVIFLLVLSGSAFAYNQIEGWNLLDSTYFVVISATTIGYGDLTPETHAGKVLTIFFSFFGIAFAFYYVSLISSYVFKRHLGDKKVSEYRPKYKKSGPKKKRRKNNG